MTEENKIQQETALSEQQAKFDHDREVMTSNFEIERNEMMAGWEREKESLQEQHLLEVQRLEER